MKNGGDLYSRLLNNAKPQHMKLPPRVKIGLRGLYSMFYQIYQTERIWVTLKILADRRFTITTYSKLRTAVTNNMPSFRNICRQIAASIQMDMFCFIHATDPTIPQVLTPTTPTESARQVEKTHESFTYRKAECFVKSETLTSKRLDKSLSHPCVTVEGFRARCILCCCHCTFGDGKLRERSERHPRLGHVQRFECGSCKVALCRKPRFLWMGKLESCFSLFHTVSKEELAVLAQNLCAIQNPADTPFDTMVVRAPEKVARQSALSLKMKDSWKARKTCAAEGCDMQSLYNMAGLPPKFCEQHKLGGMVSGAQEMPTQKRAYHREGCVFESCETYASFNFEGLEARFCKKHKVEGMVRVKKNELNLPAKEPTKRGPYKKKAGKAQKKSTPESTRPPAKSLSTVEVAIDSPSVASIGKTGKKSVKPTSGRKSLSLANTKAVAATNVYTGKKVVIPGLKRSALLGQQMQGSITQHLPSASTTSDAFKCTVHGCSASACYRYMDTYPTKCSAHRLQGMSPMV